MGDLYDADILEWSERQAALLRRFAAGERVNDTDMDWHNDLYRDALRRMPDTIDAVPPMPVPTLCPVTLDDLLGAIAPDRIDLAEGRA